MSFLESYLFVPCVRLHGKSFNSQIALVFSYILHFKYLFYVPILYEQQGQQRSTLKGLRRQLI